MILDFSLTFCEAGMKVAEIVCGNGTEMSKRQGQNVASRKYSLEYTNRILVEAN